MAAAGGSEEEPNELEVKIMDASGVIAGDYMEGTSDCVVKLSLGAREQRSSVKPRTLAPAWRETFTFACADGGAKLDVVLEDEDKLPFLRYDFLGRLPSLTVADFRGEARVWRAHLLNERGLRDKPRGDLQLSVRWHFNASPGAAAAAAAAAGRGDGVEKEETGADHEAARTARRLKEEEQRRAIEERQKMRVREGAYTVHVHVIEARDVKPQDSAGVSDIFVEAELLGARKQTPVHKATLGAVIDYVMVFDVPAMTRALLDEAVLNIAVMDWDALSRNDVIGRYALDLAWVYFQDAHEVYSRWVSIADVATDARSSGLTGFLRLSVVVLGPEDTARVHDDDAEAAAARRLEELGGFEQYILAPLNVPREVKFLVLDVHYAEGMPAMDRTITGRPIGIDAMITVTFAGNKVSTDHPNVAGERDLGTRWAQTLWIPVSVPTSTNVIECLLEDFDRGMNNDAVGVFHLSWRDLVHGALPATWINVYGAPNVVRLMGDAKMAMDLMNSHPHRGSTWRGRVLVSARVEDNPFKKIPEMCRVEHNAKAPTAPQSTPVELLVSLVSAAELPVSEAVGVRVTFGKAEVVFRKQSPHGGRAHWLEVKSDSVALPDNEASWPDVFVYLYTGSETDPTCICYKRLSAAGVHAAGFDGSNLCWLRLQADPVVAVVRAGAPPGTLLLRLAVGPREAVAAARQRWSAALSASKIESVARAEVRVHVFQGRNLPSADDNGSIDPYVKVRCLDATQKTERRDMTKNPSWYQTLVFDSVELPLDLDYAPELSVALWDHDKFSEDDYCGELRMSLGSLPDVPYGARPEARASGVQVLDCSGRDGGRVETDVDTENCVVSPTWRALSKVHGGGTAEEGELLLLVQVLWLPRETDDWWAPLKPPRSIVPRTEQAFVDILALGIRGMQPFGLAAIARPQMEFDIDSGGAAALSGGVSCKTALSRGPDANFLQRVVIPFALPVNPLFVPTLNIIVRDHRLGGLVTPVVGVAAVDLRARLPTRAGFGHAPAAVAEAGATESKGDADPTVADARAADASRAAVGSAPSEFLVADASAKYRGDPKMAAVMKDRRAYSVELERGMQMAPFEQFDLRRGAAVRGKFLGRQLASQEKVVGKFKGRLRIIYPCHKCLRRPMAVSVKPCGHALCAECAKGPPAVGVAEAAVPCPCCNRQLTFVVADPWKDVLKNLTPQQCVVRLYVLQGHGMRPMDPNGLADPFLVVTLGKQKVDDVAIHEKETLDPLFYRCFEFSTLLPGPSQLTVDVLDYDRLTANDLIGRTVIDLEDRWFDESWRALGAEFEVPGPGTPEAPPRLRPKPLELRRLVKPPIVSRSEGQLSLWVDLLTPSEARAFPPVKIERPRSGDYEVRVIVWRTEDVLSMDTTGLNDLYVVAYVSGQEGMRQASDTHWRSKNGRGSFNWRFKFDVKLPMKYPYLTLQLFDKDVVKYNDFIAARTLSLAYYFEAALRNEGPTNCFAPPRRPAGTGPAAGMEGDTAAPTRAAPAVTDAPVTKTPRQLTGTQVAGDGGGGGGGGGGVAGVGPSGGLVVEAGRAAGGGAESAEHVVVDVAAHPASASGAAAAPVRRHQRRRRKRLALLKDKDASREARKSLRALKESIGLPDDINPKDALWITLERWYDPKRGGVRLETPMAAGRVLVSMEILPKLVAGTLPAGFGRDKPNLNPYLSPPTGRMRFSVNPFYVLSECLGPRVCLLFGCVATLGGAISMAIWGAPFLNTIIQWCMALPRGWATLLIIATVLLCCGAPAYCAGRRAWVRYRIRNARPEESDGEEGEEWETDTDCSEAEPIGADEHKALLSGKGLLSAVPGAAAARRAPS